MFKKYISAFMVAMGIVNAALSPVQAAEKACIPIGGMAMANFVPQKDGTIAIVAPLVGSVAATSGKVIAQRKTATGLEMDMEHYFMSDKGGFIQTKDAAILSSVVGKKDRYMIEITYVVQAASASGVFKGYRGSFKSYGLVDLENLQGLIRYSGELCK